MEVPFRDHFNELSEERLRRFSDLWVAHMRVHDQEAVSRAESARRIDARLEALNELRSEVITDRSRLVSREVFDARVESVNSRLDVLQEQIAEWRGQGKGVSLVTTAIVGVVGFVATVLAIYFALN